MLRPCSTSVAFLALVAACSPTIDEYEPHTGLVRGTLVYPAGTARGNAIVLLFRADDPPPPEGSGRPINFVVVPERSLFRGAPAGEAHDFTLPFTLPTVPAGAYQLRAFLDADGDFNPIYDLLAQPSAGDVAGGFVDLSTGRLRTLEVQNDQVVDGFVVVSLGLELPVERPAFAWRSEARIESPLLAPVAAVIEAHAIEGTEVRFDPERTRFLIDYVDADFDDTPDDANGDHLPDVYPRVLLRRVEEPNVVVPVVTNPLPFLDRLDARERVLTDLLELIIPPIAVRLELDGSRTALPSIPLGLYETIVIASTGQTWQIPNELQRIDGNADPTQVEPFEVVEGSPLPAGTISGTLHVQPGLVSDTFVFAFREEDPPPPIGTGRPVRATSVPSSAFDASGDASFTLRGLVDGRYLVLGLVDRDRDFSLLASSRQEASAGDMVASKSAPVEVRGQGSVELSLDLEVPFEPPAFAISTEGARIPRSFVPQRIELETHALDGFDAGRVALPVSFSNGDQERDHFRDLYPRVLLTLMDGGDPRTAPNRAGPIVIPALVDPLPFISALAAGEPVIPNARIPIIVPPVAFDLSNGSALRPPPPGRYRVNLISGLGQTWSVPNDFDRVLGRVGGPYEDPTQATFLTIDDTPIPAGRIRGAIVFAEEPAGDYDVVVLAFDADDPPPPRGRGRPLASTVVPKGSHEYELGGLLSGRYHVRAFVDTNASFTPWFEALNQPDRGDLLGGHVSPSTGALETVVVDATSASAMNAPVLVSATRVPVDRPVFELVGASTISFSLGPARVVLRSILSASDVLSADGVFPVRWLDVDGDGVADDVNGDGRPDVTPLVVAEDASGALIPGIVDPRQVAGFPAFDPTETATIAMTRSLEVVFPPLAIHPATGQTFPPPLGRYRVTVVNDFGQTWSVPNELGGALGDLLAVSQSVSFEVVEE